MNLKTNLHPTAAGRGVKLAGSLGALCLALQPLLAAEWSGGADWALLDVADRRAMWVWNMGADDAGNRKWDGVHSYVRGLQNYKGSRDLCLDFCANKSIRSIYVFNATWEWNQADFDAGKIPNEAAWADLMAAATARGIQVWLMGYLWDDPNDARMATAGSKESIKKIMQAIHAFNLAHPETPIAGFHSDQEPGSHAIYDDLLDTFKIAQDWLDAHAPELLVSQALRPVWRFDSLAWNGSTRTMNEHIIGLIGHAAYMAYSDSTAMVLNTFATPACDLATAAGHKVAVGLEVADIAAMYTNAHKNTWYEEIQGEPAATRFKADPADPETFEDCLHDVAATLRTTPGYDRIVIHEYGAYFAHWFGQHPRNYILSRPGGIYDPSATNPPSVDLANDARLLVGLGPGSNYAQWAPAHGLGTTHSAMKSADPDQDGRSNFLEYAFALDPLSNDFQVADFFGLDASENIHYVVRNLRDELTYAVEISTNLHAWMPHSSYAGQTGAAGITAILPAALSRA